jgi:perosamine synthetase
VPSLLPTTASDNNQTMADIPFGKPTIGTAELDAVREVLESGVFVHGPRTEAFEKSFGAWTGSPHAVSVSSCTAGMHLFYFDSGIGVGDEVIVPAQTHVATAHAVELTGATPIFVDAEPVTGNIDVAAIEAALTDRTRAIAVVHFLGEPADMSSILTLARSRDLLVLEDCALAVGTYIDGVHAGLLGDAGCFSFYPVKHMTTAEGGMVVTRHQALAQRLSRKRAFGVDRTPGERKEPGVYDVTMLGFNYRMNEISAALGVEQVKRLDNALAKRRSNFEALADALAEIDEVTILRGPGPGASSEGSRSSYYCLEVVLAAPHVRHRAEVVGLLKELGIGSSVYYPKPVPAMRYYQDRYGYDRAAVPVAAWISEGGIALPVGPHLEPEDMFSVANALKKAIKQVIR